jgi:2-haloacid dehalogenase
MPQSYEAVLFDLLTALLDSWSLWNAVAGSEEGGMRWRRAYLARTYATGAYRPYETLVAEAAEEVGVHRGVADELAARYGELRPWPGVAKELRQLSDAGVKLGVATNCSEALGQVAAACVGVAFDAVVTAERAGFYKPDPAPYRLALTKLEVAPARCLFVAGSAYDLVGASRVGLDIWWHDRVGMAKPPEAPDPLHRTSDLNGLAVRVLGG